MESVDAKGKEKADDGEMDQRPDPGEEDIGVQLQDMCCKWRGREYPLTLPVTATVGDIKLLLEAETDVLAKRMKILGLVKGRLPPDETLISDLLPLPEVARFTMMGTPEASIALDPPDDLPEVVNDLSWDYRASANSEVRFRPENQMKLQRCIRRKGEIEIINPLREGKKLLVLDLDYTLIDHKARGVESLSEIERPFLHEFLACAYEDYDICVWSQTARVWLEAKTTELGMLSHPKYKVSFLLDRSYMFSIKSKIKGREREHEVKALEVIWSKLPQFSSKDTIHIDDLSRNGAMNPQSLLKISPFRDCQTPIARMDRELVYLARYLRIIRNEDFSTLDHEAWRSREGVLNIPGEDADEK